MDTGSGQTGRRARPARPRSSVTLLDVARAAGVSLATASRVVNGSVSRRPAPELIKKVTEAAERLGYSANASAQAIARGVNSVVGLIVSDIADPYFSSIAAGVTAEAEEQGLLVTLASTKGRPMREVEYLGALRRQRPMAILLVGSRRADPAAEQRLIQELRAFREDGGRAAAVSQPTLQIDTVAVRNAEGAADLARALVAQGHTRFGVLSGPADLQTAAERVTGFRGGLRGTGARLAARNLQHGEFTRDGGQQAARELLERSPDIGCLFAVNDVMAIGAMAGARELGYRVPEDLAIAGFDDIPSAADTFPPLSTVRIDLEAVGRDAMRFVLEQSGAAAPRVKYVTGDVILRASTDPSPPG
ncbi:LacI family transcriptional regulator [Amycolatopsis acidiphila]|uniref:LacI family transcriptional regulator n=1 Tax=Amycolatopsis acidiphila TaxID=715473 RepID=A0A558ALY8_9PSEU|nr:LacI family DNA-binding transcriptional regulator [Amycolatopsis acidiphila]TVT25269.1 LacI family transcriptional regulator [Amycolatopsis acidiphila]UIJ62386.1 LacI family transcriptional regulator [Amycolatopsis acidiphila]GHG83392.1 LacI family transcriptional regulator [Amycolatopsis acidiphila]